MVGEKMKANGDIVKFVKQKDYEMINNDLGSGSFGVAVLLKDPFIDELFVAKKYEPYYDEDKKEFFASFLQEIKIMYKLNHKNVVRIFNYYPFESSYTGYIIMEYIDGMSIDEYFESYLPFDDGVDPENIFVQLIDGFQYIEKQGIVHRDIREGNILITKDGTAKIIDFGLGKTFSPVSVSDDSLVEIINRSGLGRLPEKYFEGKYDSKTDMFYLAELFNRLLVKTYNDSDFLYLPILHKMMEIKRENRFSSFTEIKEAINTKDFSTLEISQEDKEIYQSFSNSIYKCLACFTQNKELVNDIHDFLDRLRNVIEKNCFEDFVQNNNDIVNIIVKQGYKFYPRITVDCDVLTNFEKWFSNLSADSQKLVFNNIIAKMSTKETEEPEPELPF